MSNIETQTDQAAQVDQADQNAQSAQSTSNPDSKLLPIPTGLTIDLLSENDVIILWEEIVDPRVEGYIIYRADEEETTLKEIARVDKNESSYTDTNILTGKTYSYRVSTYGKESEGYVNGDSEVQSIVIKNALEDLLSEQEQAEEAVQSPEGQAMVGSPATPLSYMIGSSGADDKFWLNLIAVNLVVVGGILLIYMLIRTTLERRRCGAKINIKNANSSKGVKNSKVSFKLKSDREKDDVNMKKRAEEKYEQKMQEKIEEWTNDKSEE
jgi:hypothetical protein